MKKVARGRCVVLVVVFFEAFVIRTTHNGIRFDFCSCAKSRELHYPRGTSATDWWAIDGRRSSSHDERPPISETSRRLLRRL